MAERIVVSLHLSVADTTSSGYLRRALAAKKRAEALGATMSAWGADSFAFDFGAEDVEEAVDLALATFDDPSLAEPRFSAGVAYGELSRIGSGGTLAMLAWGEPLLIASRLARSAAPGEVLIAERCPDHVTHVLRTHDERRIEGDTLVALVLDTKHPFRRDTMIDALASEAEDKVRVTVPPLPPLLGVNFLDRTVTSRQRPSEPPPPPTVRYDSPPPEIDVEAERPTLSIIEAEQPAPNGAEAASPAELDPAQEGPAISEVASRPEPLSAPVPSSTEPITISDPPRSTDALDPITPPISRPAMPPPRFPAVNTAPSVPPSARTHLDAPSIVPPSGSRASWQGSEEYVELAAAARQALLKGNVTELERLSDELKTRSEHTDLAERMAGFVAWNRGAKSEALRKLRAAADAETRPAHRVRALLAYGVALAASGRTDAALLAALGAMARAREVEDRQGEHVCARFLARLSAAAGYDQAARTWAAVAEEVVDPRAT